MDLPKLPQREEFSHKGTFGKVLNIAGSKYMPGAAYLSSVSALTIGAGYVFLASSDDVIKAVSAQTQNVVFSPFSDIEKHLKDSTVMSIGCGLSTTGEAVSLFTKVFGYEINIPVVIDADGLNILSGLTNFSLPERVILTPHPKEAARLLETDLNNVLDNFEESAKEISRRYNCTTILKSHNTVVCSKDLKIYINTTGNSAMAKAGSGDVLTGMISGLLAQGMNDFDAAILGCYLHGLSGDLAKNDLTEYCVSAKDLVRYISNAAKSYID